MMMLVQLIRDHPQASLVGALLLSLQLTNSVGEFLQHCLGDELRSAADHFPLHVHVDPKSELNRQQHICGLLYL